MTEDDLLKEEIMKARSGQKEVKEAKGKKTMKKVLSFFLLLLLWCGVVYGGYILAEEQFQRKAEEFSEQVNVFLEENRRIGSDISATLANFQEEIQRLQDEMGLIKEELELASESITGTDATRQSLQVRIAELDRQLASLREQLRKLEEATRAL